MPVSHLFVTLSPNVLLGWRTQSADSYRHGYTFYDVRHTVRSKGFKARPGQTLDKETMKG